MYLVFFRRKIPTLFGQIVSHDNQIVLVIGLNKSISLITHKSLLKSTILQFVSFFKDDCDKVKKF